MTYEQWVLLGHVFLFARLELVFDLPLNSPRDNDLRSHMHDKHNQVLVSSHQYLLWHLLSDNHARSGQTACKSAEDYVDVI